MHIAAEVVAAAATTDAHINVATKREEKQIDKKKAIECRLNNGYESKW